MSPINSLAITEHRPDGSRADAPLVVLVHGSLDRSDSFTRVLRRLDDLHTVVYDRRGYHHSRGALPVGATLDGHVDDLFEVIDGRPAVVVGHSFGGDVALGAALRDGRSSTVLSVAAYEPPMPWLAGYRRSAPTPAAPPPTAGAGRTGDDAGEAAERFFRRMVGDAAWERLPEHTKAARRADGPALEAELTAIRVPDAPFDVSALTIPATFGRGEHSASRHRYAVAWLLEHAPGAQLVEIPGASHGAHLTHPGGFADLVRAAVAGAGRPIRTTS